MANQPTTESQEVHLTALDVRMTAAELRVANLEEKVDYHNKVLVRGNGQPSLVEEVHQVVQFMVDQKDNYKYWSRWIIAGILANVVGFLTAAFLWFVKIAPLLEEVVKLHSP